MAVYAPSDDPSYVYGSPPPPGMDPSIWARVKSFASGLNPIGSAQAATADSVQRSPNPLATPSPVPPQLVGGGLPVPDSLVGHGDGPPPPPPPVVAPPPPPIGAGASGGFTGYDPLSSIRARQPLDLNDPRTRNMPWPTAPSPMGPPVPPGGVQPAIATAAAPIDPRMRGEVPAAQNPWFTSAFDRPNMNPGLGGGMMGGALAGGRGGGGPPQMGMLDLSGIFRGGQPAAAAVAPAQPRTKIDVGKIPANARAEVPPVSPGPVDPSIIARQRMKRPKASSSSQGGGY